MDRIGMRTPLVEMDGDEMTRILWALVKSELIEPFVDLKTEYYDLGLENRDATGDAVTREAAAAVKRLGVGVKCATITPNAQRVEEYSLKSMWPSPNGTIRAMLDGTVFRAPIPCAAVKPFIPGWKKPIIIARHAYADLYRDAEMRIEGPGLAEIAFTPEGGAETRREVYRFEGPGVLQGCYNKDSSIRSFARACFGFALSQKMDLWFSAKDTIMKTYDGLFKSLFAETYEKEFREKFEAAGIEYFYTLIDDAVARAVRSSGGFVWALKNYDGDVMSDMVATAFGSLAMMTSVLAGPGGVFEYEAAHGTVTRHYYRRLKGEKTSTNPIATIFAWTGAMRKRGEMDSLPRLQAFADALEKAVRGAVAAGEMTGDLAAMADASPRPPALDSESFIAAVRARLAAGLSAEGAL